MAVPGICLIQPFSLDSLFGGRYRIWPNADRSQRIRTALCPVSQNIQIGSVGRAAVSVGRRTAFATVLNESPSACAVFSQTASIRSISSFFLAGISSFLSRKIDKERDQPARHGKRGSRNTRSAHRFPPCSSHSSLNPSFSQVALITLAISDGPIAGPKSIIT